MRYHECERCGKWSPRLSVFANAFAAVFKIFIGTLTNSMGLVADGVHSIGDAFASAFIVLALTIANKPVDEKHPYGYGKFEYVSTLFAATFLFGCATLILFDTVKAFTYGIHELPEPAALLATAVTLGFSYLMYRSNLCAGTEMGSPAIIADAYESKADSLSSLAVLVGLIGTELGFIYADALAAAAVSLLIYHMSMEMYLQGIHGLIDSAADQDAIDAAVRAALSVDEVIGVQSSRARRMGQKFGIDLVIEVSDKKTVMETHMTAEKVKQAVTDHVESVSHIRVECYPVRDTILDGLLRDKRRHA
ncbi:MAG: cation diffusion facilitator family transporter [Acidobacteriota bacterium]